MGKLREKYGDITVPSLEQVVDEIMKSKSLKPRILIGEATDQRDVMETTKQLMTRLLTAVSMTSPIVIPATYEYYGVVLATS